MKAKLKVVLPFIVCLAIQLIIAIVASNICSVKAAMELGADASNIEALTDRTLELYQGIISMVLCIVHLVNALVMLLWIRKYTKVEPYNPLSEDVKGNRVIMIILGAIGIECAILGCMNVMSLFWPGIFDSFSQLMQSANIGELTFFSIFATVILAPIGEELVFRGLTMRFLKKAGASLLVANIIQAVLFGVMHLNLVQGIYAAIMGLLLGYVAIKYNSVKLCILMHVVINGSSTVISNLPLEGVSDGVFITGLFVIAAAGLAGFYMLDRKNEAVVVEEPVIAMDDINETESCGAEINTGKINTAEINTAEINKAGINVVEDNADY